MSCYLYKPAPNPIVEMFIVFVMFHLLGVRDFHPSSMSLEKGNQCSFFKDPPPLKKKLTIY